MITTEKKTKIDLEKVKEALYAIALIGKPLEVIAASRVLLQFHKAEETEDDNGIESILEALENSDD